MTKKQEAQRHGIRTLCPQIFKRFFISKGLSLLEILVVLLLMGLITGTILSRTAWKKNEVKEFHKDFRKLSREIFLKARLKNTLYRMVFKISDFEEEEPPSVVVYAESRAGKAFEKDENQLLKKLNFPEEIHYKNLLSKLKENEEESFEETLNEELNEEEKNQVRKLKFFYRYIYFLPQGFVSPVAIHVEQKKQPWTFTIEALTGKVKILKGYISLEEIEKANRL